MSLSGNSTSIYKILLIIAYSGQERPNLHRLRWEIAKLEFYGERKALYVVKSHRKWIIKLQNIISIERLDTEIGDVLKIRLKGNKFVLLYSTPAIVMKVAEILSRETGIVISDVVAEKELLEGKKESSIT